MKIYRANIGQLFKIARYLIIFVLFKRSIVKYGIDKI